MSALTSKLEMSLDEIIKVQKKKNGGGGAQAKGAAALSAKKFGSNLRGRKNLLNGKKRISTFKGQRRQIGFAQRRQNLRQGLKKIGRNNFATKRMANFNNRRRMVGIGKRFVGGIKKNNNINNNAAKNRAATVLTTKNLVKKLVKKAIAQNVVANSLSPKFVQIPVAAAAQMPILRPSRFVVRRAAGRTLLNKLNAKSRVIARRHRIAMAVASGAGQVSMAPFQTTTMESSSRFATMPNPVSRRLQRKKIFYVQQGQAVVKAQQQQPQGVSVRQQINAMRRAAQVQQLQAQFLNQQQLPQQRRNNNIFQPAPRQQRQQVIQVVKQQQRRRQPMLRRQQQQQYIMVEQQQPQQSRFGFRRAPKQQQQKFGRQQRWGDGGQQNRFATGRFQSSGFEAANFLRRF